MKDLPVIIQPYKQSRSLRLKFCPYRHSFIVTTPPKIREKEVSSFLTKNQQWMQMEFQRHLPASPLKVSDEITVLGDTYVLSHDPLRKTGVWERDNVLWLGGSNPSEDLGDFVVPWLKKRAHLFFADCAQDYASTLGVSFDRISVRDTVSRWGSCSTTGTLSFNWRLALAPLAVAEYVCAHEVSHRVEMNHSPQFWSLVERLCPAYKTYRLWLRRHGATLYSKFPLRQS